MIKITAETHNLWWSNVRPLILLEVDAWDHVSQVMCQDHMMDLRSRNEHTLGDVMRTEPWHSDIASNRVTFSAAECCEASAISGHERFCSLLQVPDNKAQWQQNMRSWRQEHVLVLKKRPTEWTGWKRIKFLNTENEIQLVLLHTVLRITLNNYTFVQLI